MSIDLERNLVVAGTGPDGQPCFLERGAAQVMHIPGVIEAAFLWGVNDIPALPLSIGGAPERTTMPGPGGSVMGVVRFPARSAGKLDAKDVLHESTEGGQEDNAAMHATATVDYEIILSGKIDIVLPGNQRRTLKAGDMLVMGGVAHAWENVYDDDCTYVFVVVGATGKAS